MAAPIKPSRHLSQKKDSFWLVPTIADVDAPKDTEINAVSGIYATCFLRGDQAGATKTVNKVQLDTLLCEDKQFEGLAPSQISHPDLVGVFDPQAGPSDDDKALFEFLRDGYEGFLVRRQNKTNDTDDQAAIGDYVDVFPVAIDSSWPDKSGAGPEGFYQFLCGVAVTNEPGINVAVVDGTP